MKKNIAAIILLSLSSVLHSAPTLHPLFSDRAVLQRDVVLPVFGAANPGETVTVTLGDRSATAKADEKGQWRVEFPPAPASAKPITLEALGEDGEPARATDILMGDVWLLSGQSNMHHVFRSYSLLKDTLGQINDPELRILYIDPSQKPVPTNGNAVPNPFAGLLSLIHPVYQKSWQPACLPYLSEFSPAGYYLGAALRRDLKVPIGLVLSAVGGTQIERWLPPEEAVKTKLSAFFVDTPSNLYEKMIAPLRGFAWRGVAWYQGESNSNDPESYGPLLESLIAGWRRELGVAGRPFLIVQIAPFVTNSRGQSWAWLRDQQSQVANKTENAGLVVTLDVGEGGDIHPQNKQPVGERLALWALRDAGKDVQAASPRFKSQEIIGSELVLNFAETGGGLKTQRVAMNRKPKLPFGEDPEAAVAPADKLVGFEICGEDRVFHPAEARIEGDKVVLSSSSVPQPVAARYAWDNFPLANLFGGTGLPAGSFRTDDFSPPDFGLPIEGVPVPSDAPGAALTLLKDGKENPYAPVTTIDGREAHAVLPTQNPELKFKGRYIYAKLPDTAVKPGEPVVVSIIYRDDFRNVVKLRYDSSDESVKVNRNNPGAFKELGSFRMAGSGQWRIAEFQVRDGSFRGRCNGADIRLESTPDKDLVINGIYVRPATSQ